MANTAMLGSLMVPEMNRRGYKPHMSIGPIIGTGGLANLAEKTHRIRRRPITAATRSVASRLHPTDER